MGGHDQSSGTTVGKTSDMEVGGTEDRKTSRQPEELRVFPRPFLPLYKVFYPLRC